MSLKHFRYDCNFESATLRKNANKILRLEYHSFFVSEYPNPTLNSKQVSTLLDCNSSKKTCFDSRASKKTDDGAKAILIRRSNRLLLDSQSQRTSAQNGAIGFLKMYLTLITLGCQINEQGGKSASRVEKKSKNANRADLFIWHPRVMSLVAFFPYPTCLLGPTYLRNLHKISTLLVYLALFNCLIGT